MVAGRRNGTRFEKRSENDGPPDQRNGSSTAQQVYRCEAHLVHQLPRGEVAGRAIFQPAGQGQQIFGDFEALAVGQGGRVGLDRVAAGLTGVVRGLIR